MLALLTYLIVVSLSNDVIIRSTGVELTNVGSRGDDDLLAVHLFNGVGSLGDGGDRAGVRGVEGSSENESGACHCVL